MKKMTHVVAVVALVLLSAAVVAESSTGSWDHFCSADSYTAHSRYEETLKLLPSRLHQTASASAPLFARGTARSDLGEIIYAVAQCRGDTNSSACNKCVSDAFQDAQVSCRYRKGARIFQDLCTVRFSNKMLSWRSDVENMQDIVAGQANSSGIMKNTKQFRLGVDTLITAVTSRAANSSSRFATASEQIEADGNSYKVYGMAQCIGEMGHAECGLCLLRLASLDDQVGKAGRRATTWCSYRVELDHFFIGDPMLILPPVSSLVPEGTKKKPKIIWVVVVIVSLLVITLGLAFAFFWRKRRNGEGCFDFLKSLRAKRPSAIKFFNDITANAKGKTIVLFLDYDGTLTPIVDNPEMAFMSEEMRDVVRDAASVFSTLVVTGRGRDKVKEFIQLNELHYAGSHGQDIQLNDGTDPFQPNSEYLPIITEATERLQEAVREIKDATVENNKFCVSVHYWRVDDKKEKKLLKKIVSRTVTEFPDLKVTRGKKVREVRPKEKFDKGDAVKYLLQHLIDRFSWDSSQLVAIYIGDDKTDEDAFKVLAEEKRGFGIRVLEKGKRTKAPYSLENPSEVKEFLQKLVSWRREQDQA